MRATPNFPSPYDDDGDYSEILALALARFLDAIEQTPILEHGFGLHDVRKVCLAWEFIDSECPANGYLVDLVDGRRIMLEVLTNSDSRDVVTIMPLSPDAMPERRREDETLAPWYEAHHITLHIAELKLLPPDSD